MTSRRTSTFDVAKFETRMAFLLGKIDLATTGTAISPFKNADDETADDSDDFDAEVEFQEPASISSVDDDFSNTIPEQFEEESSAADLKPVSTFSPSSDNLSSPSRLRVPILITAKSSSPVKTKSTSTCTTPPTHFKESSPVKTKSTSTSVTPIKFRDVSMATSPPMHSELQSFVLKSSPEVIVAQLETLVP